MNRRTLIKIGRTLCLLLFACALSQVCFAHAILMKSTPVAKSVVAGASLPIELSFNSRIDGGRSHLSLTGPDAKEVTLAPTTQPRPQTLVSSAGHLTPGPYTLHWVVLANDGHITKGDIPFTVK